jgi:hypothetical protein
LTQDHPVSIFQLGKVGSKLKKDEITRPEQLLGVRKNTLSRAPLFSAGTHLARPYTYEIRRSYRSASAITRGSGAELSIGPVRVDAVEKVFLCHRAQLLRAVGAPIRTLFRGIRCQATNSPETSVVELKAHRMEIGGCFVFRREISRSVFWDFFDSIGQSRHFGRRPAASGLPGILLQKSFCTEVQKFCGLWARLSCKYVRDLIASLEAHSRLR